MSAAVAQGPGLSPSLPLVVRPAASSPPRLRPRADFVLAPAKAASTLPLQRCPGDLFFFLKKTNDSINVLCVFGL